MIVNNPNCVFCESEIELCEGDILQLYQENVKALIGFCEKCGNENEITIKENILKLKVKRS